MSLFWSPFVRDYTILGYTFNVKYSVYCIKMGCLRFQLNKGGRSWNPNVASERDQPTWRGLGFRLVACEGDQPIWKAHDRIAMKLANGIWNWTNGICDESLAGYWQ